jgi:hypothetical protein
MSKTSKEMFNEMMMDDAGDYKKALTAYKGICKLGREQAQDVLNHSKEL